jgi:uncharacterized protein YigA (DUF484 family)
MTLGVELGGTGQVNVSSWLGPHGDFFVQEDAVTEMLVITSPAKPTIPS